MWKYDSGSSLFLFVSAATHGLVLVFVSVFGEIQFGFRMGHSGWTFHFFSGSPTFVTALFTMCDWIEVLGGVGTTKSGVAYCFCVTFACSLTDFPLELHVSFSFFILYSFITLYWIGFQKLLLAGSDVLFCIACG